MNRNKNDESFKKILKIHNMKKVIFILVVFLLSSCKQGGSGSTTKEARAIKKAEIKKVDYDCLINDPFGKAALFSYNFEKDLVKSSKVKITEADETEYGEKLFDEIKKQYRVLNNSNSKKLENMMSVLLEARPEKRKGYQYHIYLLDDNTVNAFTAGGYVFVFQGLLDYCSSDNELAFILAHEIAHNELNHMQLILKRIKMGGQLGEILYVAKQLIAASFNQFDELEADSYAIDLLMATTYDPKPGINFWKKMAADNKENPNLFEKFFMSHPYSTERYECSSKHLNKNYNVSM
jgi:predicted Zn-dependent protease